MGGNRRGLALCHLQGGEQRLDAGEVVAVELHIGVGFREAVGAQDGERAC